MGAIVQGKLEDFPRVEKRGFKWFFRAFYKEVFGTDEYTMAEVCLMSKDIPQAVLTLNDFAKHEMQIEDRIDERYFDGY